MGNKDVWKYAANQDTTNANVARSVKSSDYKQHMFDVIQDQFGSDLPSLATIADWLNENGYSTPRGHQFTRAAVQRVLSISNK